MAEAASFDFFENQEIARRRTALLIAYYAVAVVLIMIAVYLAFALAFLGSQSRKGGPVGLANL